MQRFWTTAQLLALGRTERQLRAAVEAGAVRPVRKGLVTLPDTPEQVVRAARVGGVLTGPSATRALGIWTPPDAAGTERLPRDADANEAARLHVAAARRDHRLRDPDDATRLLRGRTDVVVHREPGESLAAARRTGIAPILMVLRHVLLALEPAWAVAVLDSALQQRHLRERDLPALMASLPPRLGVVVAAVDGRAESGLESIVRVLLRAAGLRVDVLVHLPGIGVVDLLVEGRLVIELDGRAWHDDPQAFARDRRRDLVAAAERYRVLRFTWSQVLFQWPEVERAVFAALAD
ncbi:endonuclease domain-containing protein [Amnibacterium endophyticum]|uniref:Endonuclease domain-containing protein n=1 Tax=Amnibacterium endophyticum TaxID=2109337 RepID=A0ABW4LJ65_9MICO